MRSFVLIFCFYFLVSFIVSYVHCVPIKTGPLKKLLLCNKELSDLSEILDIWTTEQNNRKGQLLI